MSNFKIGDNVIVVAELGDELGENIKIGDIGVVINILEGMKYPVRLNINNQKDYGFEEGELEPLNYKEYIGTYDLPYVEFEAYKIIAENYEDAKNKFKNKLIEDGYMNENWKDVDECITIIPLWELEVVR